MYPRYAKIKDKKYEINTDFNVALQCFEVINDDTISDLERVYAIVYLLFNFIPDEDINLFFEKAVLFLKCGENETNDKTDKEIDMDFNQDKKYIVASLLSDYRKDLTKEKLHFWYFIDLIQGLKNDCVLNRIREIRNYDLSDLTDSKTRKKMEELKKQFALKKQKTKHKKTSKEKNNAKHFLEQLGLGGDE